MSRLAELPEGVLLAWYGDDLAGASAVLEVLTFGGLPSDGVTRGGPPSGPPWRSLAPVR
jgi:hypothetical protein